MLNACEVAFSIIRKHKRWNRKPYVRRLMLKLDNQTYRLHYLTLRIPVKPRQFHFITLKGADYQLSFLNDKTLKRGSVTITPNTVVVAFSKETTETEPLGKVAYDLNLRNVVGVSTSSLKPIRCDISSLLRMREQYNKVKSHFKRNDIIARQKIFSKYGEKQKNKERQKLNVISKQVVQNAKKNRLAIVLENLKHVRRSHMKGNGEGKRLRRKLNSWSFRELQRQIEYKANWEGVKVEYVGAKNTSKTCSVCGKVNSELGCEKVWLCPFCGARLDRDVNASVNIVLYDTISTCSSSSSLNIHTIAKIARPVRTIIPPGAVSKMIEKSSPTVTVKSPIMGERMIDRQCRLTGL
jgi:putative transposase